MNIHSKRSEQKASGEKKKFSFKSHGITSYHAAPAALMVVAGLALSAVISDVPPNFNQVYASTVEEQAEQLGNYTAELNASISGLLNITATNPVIEENEKVVTKTEEVPEEPVRITEGIPEVNYSPSLATHLIQKKKDSEKEKSYDFTSHISSLSEEDAAKKLDEIERADRERELWEASGQVVASSNRNLYLDTYRYQRGPSNIPSTGLYTSCVPGQVISQLQPPPSLTFDENGVPENYLYYIDGKATAYYDGNKTSTGSATRPGVVAVDPREIPYGTEMWIVSLDGKYVYGFARAEDTGGFIYWKNGATVDLFMNTYSDCYTWGFRGVRIYILPTSYK
ncbi:MAG: 3D domain-containing protein [Clostridia bacterium]|nr:3D domain-containing protein [Clostridia bacterium]